MLEIFIGWDPREVDAFKVAAFSILRRTEQPVHIEGIRLQDCVSKKLFWREQQDKGGQLWDMISKAPCATEFSISRFLTPHLASDDCHWALFMDCDQLVMDDISDLLNYVDDKYAVICTKHMHHPENFIKMDNKVQTLYKRKNWSSFMLFNCKHPSNKKLTVDMINTLPGRSLHAFSWLKDEEIGSLPLRWNHLVGYAPPADITGRTPEQYRYGNPSNIHFTEGMPFMKGYEDCEYAEEWRLEKSIMDKGRVTIETR